MRKQDIEIGREYAVVEYEGGTPQRVRVEAFDQPRHVYSGARDFHGHTSRDGVLVTKLDTNTGEPFTRTVTETVELDEPVYRLGLPPVTTETIEREVAEQFVTITRKIVSTWDEEIDRQALRATSEAKRQDYVKAQDAALAEVNTKLTEAGLTDRPLTFDWDHWSKRVRYDVVTIKLADLAALVDRADL